MNDQSPMVTFVKRFQKSQMPGANVEASIWPIHYTSANVHPTAASRYHSIFTTEERFHNVLKTCLTFGKKILPLWSNHTREGETKKPRTEPEGFALVGTAAILIRWCVVKRESAKTRGEWATGEQAPMPLSFFPGMGYFYNSGKDEDHLDKEQRGKAGSCRRSGSAIKKNTYNWRQGWTDN